MNFWTFFYQLREARQGLARNGWASLAAVVLLTLALVMFGGFLWVNSNLQRVAAFLEQQVNIRVFPEEGLGAESLRTRLSALPGVAAVEIMHGVDVYDQLGTVFGPETLANALPKDVFSDTLSVQLEDPDGATQVVDQMRAVPGVTEVVWGKGYAQTLYGISQGMQRLASTIVIALFLASFLTSLTAIHLTILSRESEIRIQRWIGVSPWGVRAQFLIEALLLGILAALIAGAILVYMGDAVQEALFSIMPVFHEQLHPVRDIIGAVLLTGPALCLLGGALASQRAIGVGD